MFWPSMNMNVHPHGKIKFHDIYQESCTPLKTYIGQYSRETEPRSIINTDIKLLYMWGPIYICQPLILVCLVIHSLMPQPPSSQCLQKLKT